jgi:hypothetical protein
MCEIKEWYPFMEAMLVVGFAMAYVLYDITVTDIRRKK